MVLDPCAERVKSHNESDGMIIYNLGSLLNTDTTRVVNLASPAVGFTIVNNACPIMSVSADGGVVTGLNPTPGKVIPLPARQRYVFQLPTVFTSTLTNNSLTEDWQFFYSNEQGVIEKAYEGRVMILAFQTKDEMNAYQPGKLIPLVLAFGGDPTAGTSTWSLQNMLYNSLHIQTGNGNTSTWQLGESYLDMGISTGTTVPASDDPDLREAGNVLCYLSNGESPASRRSAVTLAGVPLIQALCVYENASNCEFILRFQDTPQTEKVKGVGLFRYLQSVTVGTVTAGMVMPVCANGTLFGLNTTPNACTSRVGRYAIDFNGDWFDLASNALASGAHAGAAYRSASNINLGNFPALVFELAFGVAAASVLWEVQFLH